VASVSRNIFASFAGQGFVAALALVLAPVYVHMLGIEAYGVIGLYAMAQVLLALLDMGLSAALSRELARLSVSASNAQTMRDLTRTLELVYWAAAVAIAAAGTWIASKWLLGWIRLDRLDAKDARAAISLMAVAFAARWPATLYVGALAGLQHQVLMNVLRILTEAVRGIGAAAALWFIAPTLRVFFWWQILAGALMSLVFGIALWSTLPRGRRPSFDGSHLRRLWRYFAGLTGVGITAAVLTQADKLVLSKVLSLRALGYYTLSWAVANALTQFSSPIVTAYMPRFAQAIANRDRDGLRRIYHEAATRMSLLVVPLGLVIALFSETALTLWTHDREVASHASLILAMLTVGSMFNALASMPYILQITHGWTSLTFVSNLAAIAVILPMTYVLALRWGGEGAAVGWLVLNVFYVTIVARLMHRRILRSEFSSWFWRDVMLPVSISAAVIGVWRWASAPDAQLAPVRALLYFGLAYITSVLVCFGAASAVEPAVVPHSRSEPLS
jgi:O-antigen/teichoic acid export membrane protein